MYRIIAALVLGCILFPSVLLAQSANGEAEKPKFVMILNSYSYDKEWSTALAKEIRNCLESQNAKVLVNVTYAAISAHTSFLADRFAMQGAFAYGRLNNKIFIPNVLVLIGDESWMLYRIMDHRGLWGNVPVVLCGVHEEVMKDYQAFFPDKQLPDTCFIPLRSSVSNLRTTAVIEQDNTPQTLKLACKLRPHLQSLYYLSDGSYADTYMKMKLEQSCKQKGVLLNEILVGDMNTDSLTNILEKLPAQSIIVTNRVTVPLDVHIPVLTLREMAYQSNNPVGGYFVPLSAIANQTVKAVTHFLEADKASEMPYSIASDAAYYLNQTALLNAGLRSTVKDLPGAVDRNVPPPFLIRHIRVIAIVLLILLVLTIVTFRTVYAYRYRRNLKVLFDRYKSLYDEYQVVYDNMPVGLMLFDTHGNLLKRNAETNQFFEHFVRYKNKEFRLFDTEFMDKEMHVSLFRRKLINKIVYLQDYSYRVQCCLISDEETNANQILVIVIDYSDIEKEKKAKEQISNVLNFAMNKAVIGVAEYNLANGVGFATDAWYDTLRMERDITDFSQAHACLVDADKERVANYLEKVRLGVNSCFLENLQLQTPEGESHYIRFMIQLLEYAPEWNHIIVAELILNVDEEVAKERELDAARRKAQEADRFKNAFVANMKDEIRIPLKEVITCAQKLVVTDELDARSELNARIEAGNDQMLKLLDDIINVSKVESDV